MFILRRVARQLTLHPDDASKLLQKPAEHTVADSGLWRHLQVQELPVADLATLVAASSDNLASNALIQWLGLGQIQEYAAEWVDGGSTLCDYFRDDRDARHAPTVSHGSAADYVRMMLDVNSGQSSELRAVRDWMSTSMDMSLVGAAVGIDPLSHYHPHRYDCVNKTGCDIGVRADVGVITGHRGAVAYAAICNWERADESSTTASVIDDMRQLGLAVVNWLGYHEPR